MAIPQDSGYSDVANKAMDKAGQMSDARDQGMADAGQGQGGNPIADALRTLALFVTAQKQSGNPQAEAMKQALLAFMQSTKGGQSPQEEEPPVPEGEQPQAPPAGPASPGEQFAQQSNMRR